MKPSPNPSVLLAVMVLLFAAPAFAQYANPYASPYSNRDRNPYRDQYSGQSWAAFDARHKLPVIANTAIARELAGWCWSLAVLD